MGFKLSANVIYAKTAKEINKDPDTKGVGVFLERIESVGVWPGEELFNSETCPDGILTKITNHFKRMKRPSPMTFTWKPPEGKRMLFHNIKNRKLSVMIGVNRNNDSAAWGLQFTEVDIFRISKSRKGETIEATFKDFNIHPNL